MLNLIRRLIHRPCHKCEKLGAELQVMGHRFHAASRSQAAYDRRIVALKRDHPELWVQYFARQKAPHEST